MKELSMDGIGELAARFWLKTGLNPTHVLMTADQQREFSKVCVPKEKFVLASGREPNEDGNLATIYLNATTVIDVLTVVPLRSGRTNPIDYPKVIRIED